MQPALAVSLMALHVMNTVRVHVGSSLGKMLNFSTCAQPRGWGNKALWMRCVIIYRLECGFRRFQRGTITLIPHWLQWWSNSHGVHNETHAHQPHNCGQPPPLPGGCVSVSAHISPHLPERSTAGTAPARCSDHMCRHTTKCWSHYLAHCSEIKSRSW